MSRRILSTLNLPVSCSPSFGMTATAQTACVCPARVITDFPSNQTRAVLGKKRIILLTFSCLSISLTCPRSPTGDSQISLTTVYTRYRRDPTRRQWVLYREITKRRSVQRHSLPEEVGSKSRISLSRHPVAINPAGENYCRDREKKVLF